MRGCEKVVRNIVLRCSALGNRIYAGTVSKRDPNVMNDSKVDVTDEAIKAVFQHLQELYIRSKGEQSGYGYPGLGEIHFRPLKEEKKKD